MGSEPKGSVVTYFQKRKLEILWPRKRKVYRTRVQELSREIQEAAQELSRKRRQSGLLEAYWRGV
jgi:hypothetical protein